MASRTSAGKSVILYSFLALLMFLWGVLLDWHFVVSDYGLSINQLGIGALIYTLLVGGWIWALIISKGGSRRAVYGLLAYALFLCAYALMDLIAYCPTTCPQVWLYYIANWGNLVLGIGSAVSLGFSIKKSRSNQASST